MLDTNSELESSIFIQTAAEPIAGECHVNPSSGIAGATLFSLTCSNFQDVYGVHSLFYYYYERYESDQDGLGSYKHVNILLLLLLFYLNRWYGAIIVSKCNNIVEQ